MVFTPGRVTRPPERPAESCLRMITAIFEKTTARQTLRRNTTKLANSGWRRWHVQKNVGDWN
jgi:hypothetical protein